MKITLTDIEREAYKDSPVHRLDGRVKILATIAIIIFAVSLPRMDEANFMKLAIIELYLISLLAIAKLNPVYTLMRFLFDITIWTCHSHCTTFCKAAIYRFLYSIPA